MSKNSDDTSLFLLLFSLILVLKGNALDYLVKTRGNRFSRYFLRSLQQSSVIAGAETWGARPRVLFPLRAAMSGGPCAGPKLRRVNEVPNVGNVAKARLYTAVGTMVPA
ncbi:unnamed protein product [Bursaphelenchus xylophilus]|uniref:(pine wood nematode) hypothetical protein n=1 Tax=Bursaphelenchus xylophilus TaxID=6326 RepID=A0A1I7S1A2_BURXY|nr:unnamed protein product [Bursaphelenchus xylophilus]CAG9080180.1 unnamed protein product [Bursaphelenchus xylophilus]